MKLHITVACALAAVFGATAVFALPYGSVRLDCPPNARISAAAQGEWSGDAAFQTLDLTDVSLGNRLYCVYEGCVSGMLFNLSREVPADYPDCSAREDRKGFVCRNYRLTAPAPLPPGRFGMMPYPYPFPRR